MPSKTANSTTAAPRRSRSRHFVSGLRSQGRQLRRRDVAIEASLFADFMFFQYDDFRDLRDTNAPVGDEPLYDFNSTVLRAFVSFWF